MIKKIAKIILLPFFGKTYFQGFFKLLHLFALRGMNFGGGTLPKESGEEWVVKYVVGNTPEARLVVFDVGANKGDYTDMWLRLSEGKKVSVYAFEPSIKLFKHLSQRFEGKSVNVHNLALGDKVGEFTLFAESEGSGLGSLYERDLKHAGVTLSLKEKVKATTLDIFCQNNNLKQIDFLKLDVEGYELNVLKGSKEKLAKGEINFIQFEFGGTDIDARVYFKDFYTLLSPRYRIYRILKNGLQEIYKYSEMEEIFMTTNYLAVLRNREIEK